MKYQHIFDMLESKEFEAMFNDNNTTSISSTQAEEQKTSDTKQQTVVE